MGQGCSGEGGENKLEQISFKHRDDGNFLWMKKEFMYDNSSSKSLQYTGMGNRKGSYNSL